MIKLAALLMLLTLISLTACGKKGPLYLPDDPEVEPLPETAL